MKKTIILLIAFLLVLAFSVNAAISASDFEYETNLPPSLDEFYNARISAIAVTVNYEGEDDLTGYQIGYTNTGSALDEDFKKTESGFTFTKFYRRSGSLKGFNAPAAQYDPWTAAFNIPIANAWGRYSLTFTVYDKAGKKVTDLIPISYNTRGKLFDEDTNLALENIVRTKVPTPKTEGSPATKSVYEELSKRGTQESQGEQVSIGDLAIGGNVQLPSVGQAEAKVTTAEGEAKLSELVWVIDDSDIGQLREAGKSASVKIIAKPPTGKIISGPMQKMLENSVVNMYAEGTSPSGKEDVQLDQVNGFWAVSSDIARARVPFEKILTETAPYKFTFNIRYKGRTLQTLNKKIMIGLAEENFVKPDYHKKTEHETDTESHRVFHETDVEIYSIATTGGPHQITAGKNIILKYGILTPEGTKSKASGYRVVWNAECTKAEDIVFDRPDAEKVKFSGTYETKGWTEFFESFGYKSKESKQITPVNFKPPVGECDVGVVFYASNNYGDKDLRGQALASFAYKYRVGDFDEPGDDPSNIVNIQPKLGKYDTGYDSGDPFCVQAGKRFSVDYIATALDPDTKFSKSDIGYNIVWQCDDALDQTYLYTTTPDLEARKSTDFKKKHSLKLWVDEKDITVNRNYPIDCLISFEFTSFPAADSPGVALTNPKYGYHVVWSDQKDCKAQVADAKKARQFPQDESYIIFHRTEPSKEGFRQTTQDKNKATLIKTVAGANKFSIEGTKNVEKLNVCTANGAVARSATVCQVVNSDEYTLEYNFKQGETLSVFVEGIDAAGKTGKDSSVRYAWAFFHIAAGEEAPDAEARDVCATADDHYIRSRISAATPRDGTIVNQEVVNEIYRAVGWNPADGEAASLPFKDRAKEYSAKIGFDFDAATANDAARAAPAEFCGAKVQEKRDSKVKAADEKEETKKIVDEGNPCTEDKECGLDEVCLTVPKVCAIKNLLPSGESCTREIECLSSICEKGVCLGRETDSCKTTEDCFGEMQCIDRKCKLIVSANKAAEDEIHALHTELEFYNIYELRKIERFDIPVNLIKEMHQLMQEKTFDIYTQEGEAALFLTTGLDMLKLTKERNSVENAKLLLQLKDMQIFKDSEIAEIQAIAAGKGEEEQAAVECFTDDDCPQEEYKQYCFRNECRASEGQRRCDVDSDCEPNEVCLLGQTEPVCGIKNLLSAGELCSRDIECSEGLGCVGGECAIKTLISPNLKKIELQIQQKLEDLKTTDDIARRVQIVKDLKVLQEQRNKLMLK